MSAPELCKADDERADAFGLWLCENAPRLKPFTHSEIVQRFERMLFEQRASLVVWADESSPFTGEQVKALLDENERFRDALESIEGGHVCDEEHREMARAALRLSAEGRNEQKGNDR